MLITHCAHEPLFGAKAQDLKKVLKKKNHELSLELFATRNSDAMHLAGLMAEIKQIIKEQLQDCVEKEYWSYFY